MSYPPLKSYGLNLRSSGVDLPASDSVDKLSFRAPSEDQISAVGTFLKKIKIIYSRWNKIFIAPKHSLFRVNKVTSCRNSSNLLLLRNYAL